MDKKRIIYFLILLSVFISLGLIGYYIYDKFSRSDDNEIGVIDKVESDDFENEDMIVSEDEIKNDNISTETVDVTVEYSGDYINVGYYVDEFNQNDNYKDKLLILTVNNLNIDGKNYNFKFVNHPQSCTDNIVYMDNEGYNEFYINDTKIYAQNNQACYLESVYLLSVINNKYIAVSFRGQGGNYVNIYNSDIKLIDKIEFLSLEISDNIINYSEYQEGNGCLVNKSSYTIVDGKPVKTFKEQVSNDICNEMTGEGCCN